MEVYKIPINGKMTDISELKVTELKTELKKRGVSTTGSKRDLYEKLKNYLIKNEINTSQNNNKSIEMDNSSLNNTTNSELQTSNINNESISIAEENVITVPTAVTEPEQQPLKRANEEEDALNNHKKVKHVVVVEPETKIDVDETPSIIVTTVPVEITPLIVVKETTTTTVEPVINDEIELTVNSKSVSRSNSVESQSRSPTRSLSPSIEASKSKSKSPSSNVSIKSESVIKEVPMSGDRNRFSRSRSPKSRWHASPTPDPETDKLQEIPEAKVADEISISVVESDLDKTTTNLNESVASPVVADAAKKETTSDDVKQVNSQDNSAEMPKVQRKRRWFTPSSDPLKSISTNNSVAISSDSLKTYLPDAKIPKTIDNDVLTNVSETSAVASVNDENQNTNNNRKVIKSDQNDEKYVQRQPSRTVIIEENNELIYEDALTTSSEQNSKPMTEIQQQSSTRGVDQKLASNQIETAKKDYQHPASGHVVGLTDEPERVGDVSPSREQESKIIEIKGLTRPFTLLQLKELLSKYGKIVDNRFWINNVKSHCLATYETVEEAKVAREALHRTKWPQSNPKVLRVDYASEVQFLFYQNGEKSSTGTNLEAKKTKDENELTGQAINNNHTSSTSSSSKQQTVISSSSSKKESKVTNSSSDLKSEQLVSNNKDTQIKTNSEQKLSNNRERERERDRSGRERDSRRDNNNSEKDTKQPIREWDIPKLKRSRSRSRDISMERRRKNQTEQKKQQQEKEKKSEQTEPKEEEPPAKVLEDLFRKTNSTPYIYWLPLTDEQINEREQGRKQRMEERERRRQLENEAKQKAELELKNKAKNDENKEVTAEAEVSTEAAAVPTADINNKNKRSARSRSKSIDGTNGTRSKDDKEIQNGHGPKHNRDREEKSHKSSSRNDDRSYSRSSHQQSSSRR